jgi:hypothetical protein
MPWQIWSGGAVELSLSEKTPYALGAVQLLATSPFQKSHVVTHQDRISVEGEVRPLLLLGLSGIDLSCAERSDGHAQR